MKRTRIATVSLPLVLLTLTTLIQYVGSAKATDLYNIDWGHMKRYQPDQTEMYFEANTAFAVKCMFSNRQGWSSWYAYDDLTTAANLFDTIDYRQQNDVWASDFWVGDFFGNYTEGKQLEIIDWEWSEEWQQWIPIYGWVYDGSQTMHYWFYGEISAEDPKDDHLFGHTIGSYSRQHFTFVWTCASANNMTDPNTGYQCYGFIDNENNTGEVGWPYAWTARSDLHQDGYSDPDSSDYCYIGFKGSSKPLMEGINETDYYYFSFINLFYTRLTLNYYQYTVKQSLDYASQMIWDQPWWNTTLAIGYTDEQTGEYCWMNVFGNSNLYLP